jgi:hypothetical protein
MNIRLKPNAKAYLAHFTEDGRLGQLMLVVGYSLHAYLKGKISKVVEPK